MNQTTYLDLIPSDVLGVTNTSADHAQDAFATCGSITGMKVIPGVVLPFTCPGPSGFSENENIEVLGRGPSSDVIKSVL